MWKRQWKAAATLPVAVVALNLAHAVKARGGSLPSRLAAVARGTRDHFAGRYGEAGAFSLSALFAAGLALFALTLVINFAASSIVARSRSGAESS